MVHITVHQWLGTVSRYVFILKLYLGKYVNTKNVIFFYLGHINGCPENYFIILLLFTQCPVWWSTLETNSLSQLNSFDLYLKFVSLKICSKYRGLLLIISLPQLECCISYFLWTFKTCWSKLMYFRSILLLQNLFNKKMESRSLHNSYRVIEVFFLM